MGNHVAGRMMGLLAVEALKNRRVGESALAILDRICGPHRRCDAEFEAEDPHKPGCVHPDFDNYTDPHPGAALGMLMVEAFAPKGLADVARYSPMLDPDDPLEEEAFDAWNDEVRLKFRDRFEFC